MDVNVYAQRRARLAQALRFAGGGVAVCPTAVERPRNRDTYHPYRHDSSFYYLTGFVEPEAWLVLSVGRDGAEHSTVFLRPKDEEREIWDGYRLGPEAAPAALGVDAAYPIEALDERLPNLLADQPSVWCPLDDTGGAQVQINQALAKLRARERAGVMPPDALRDLHKLVDEMRLFKDTHEQDLMRRAGEIGAAAHVRAMRTCRPGLREYHLEAEILHSFRSQGASGPSYNSIVAAGRNACVLHYAAGDAELREGDLCLIDAGCEFGSYASDITRTFPVGGRFSPAQRELYDLVLAAQDAAIEATRPGARKIDGHWAAVRVLSQGMLDLGLLNKDQHGSVDDVVASAAYRRYYMHGTGHWLGMDVHDVGDVLQRDEDPLDQPDGMGGRTVKHPSRILQPGMVLTIEPGIYVRPGPDAPERYWDIGIRIEDDALITATGCELMSRGVPVRADEIEELMNEGC